MAVVDYVESILGSVDSGYNITKGVLSAAHFGAPQKRMRFVIMGIKNALQKALAYRKVVSLKNNSGLLKMP